MHYKNLVKSFEEIDRNYTIDLERNIPDKTFGLDDSFDMSRESIENINLKIESYEYAFLDFISRLIWYYLETKRKQTHLFQNLLTVRW